MNKKLKNFINKMRIESRAKQRSKFLKLVTFIGLFYPTEKSWRFFIYFAWNLFLCIFYFSTAFHHFPLFLSFVNEAYFCERILSPSFPISNEKIKRKNWKIFTFPELFITIFIFFSSRIFLFYSFSSLLLGFSFFFIFF